MPTILDRGNAHATELAKVQAEKPSSFTVGGSFDGHYATGGITYNRSWKNGWGATAYLRAYWNDAPIIPTDRAGYVVGGVVEKKF